MNASVHNISDALPPTCRDTVTVLSSRGPRLTKRWTRDGIQAYDRAKHFTVEQLEVNGIRALSELLVALESQPTKCVIRGKPIAAVTPFEDVCRNHDTFRETPHHWVCFDVDGFVPTHADPVSDPASAVEEFLRTELPVEFVGAAHHWQLSSSAGVPGKETYLKVHVWLWLETPVSGAMLDAWARHFEVTVDKTVFRTVQVHYTAAPVIDEGVSCPVRQRSGFVEGREAVSLRLPDEAQLAALGYQSDEKRRGQAMKDPRLKPGFIGAFCRAYPPARVVEEILPDVFEFEGDSAARLTWLRGGGAPGGACITNDEEHVYNSHNTDPFAGHAVNTWDLVRHYKFGHLDGDDPGAYEFAGPTALPSDKAMREWAAGLEDVRAELPDPMEAARERFEARVADRAPSALDAMSSSRAHGARIATELRSSLGLDSAAPLPFDEIEFDAQMPAIAWEPARAQFRIMSPDGEMLQARREHFAGVMRERFPPIYDTATLETIACESAPARRLTATKTDAFVKRILGTPHRRLAELAVAHRQFTVIDASVDMFAEKGRMKINDGRLSLIFTHQPLKEGPTDDGLIADYVGHWPGLGDYLELLVASRFAPNRKAAHLWMHAESNWGKNFLMDALARHGLVLQTSSSELEKVFGGGPVGLTLDAMRRVWVLFVDEFKGVTRELKQLSDELSFSPKNQARITVPLYLKHFASAEDVPSLVSEDSGIEAQFANRFMYMKAAGVLTSRPVFAANRGAYFEAVTNHVAAEVNRLVEDYRALGHAGAGLRAEGTISALHKRYLLSNAVEGGTTTLEKKVPEIAANFAADMMRAFENDVAAGGSWSDQKARSDCVLLNGSEIWMRRSGAALDAWLDENYGRESAKVKYKRRQILDAIGRPQTIRVGMGTMRALKLGERSPRNGGRAGP
jgi:hypothetical protein